MESSSLAKTTQSVISSLWNSENESLKLGFAGANDWHRKLLLVLALGFVAYIFFWKIRRSSRLNLPPSPPSWPIIGHIHLLGPQLHQSLAQLATKYGPIMLLRIGAKATLIISSPDMAREIFKEHDLVFSQRPRTIFLDIFNIAQKGLIFQNNNTTWRNLRKIFVMELMAPEQLKSVVQIRADEIEFMLRSISRGIVNSGPMETPQEINRLLWIYTSNLASQMMLSKRWFLHEGAEEGDEAKEVRRFMDTFNRLSGTVFPADILSFLRWFDIGELQRQAEACLPWFESIAGKILAERREKRNLKGGKLCVDSDMLDVLLTRQEKESKDGGITDANIGSVIWEVFGAGTDTTMITIEWTMAHLVTNLRVMKKLQSEIDNVIGTPNIRRRVSQSDLPKLPYLLAVVKETLRLHPPSPLLLPHYSHKACNIAGYHVPANTQLFVNVWAIGHDERNWEKSNEFFPERFMDTDTGPLSKLDVSSRNFHFIPFGSGRRGCPAVSLALDNVQMAIASLVQAFDWSLPHGMEPMDFDMSEGAGLLCAPATKFRAVPKQRLPTALY